MRLDDELWKKNLASIEALFRNLENAVPHPVRTQVQGLITARYIEQTLEQALVQKLARQISGTRSAWLLHKHGYFQEQGVLQRTLDELSEDIQFLTIAKLNGALESSHVKYLEAFWTEEFEEADFDTPLKTNERTYPTRRKIRAYIRRHDGSVENETSRRNSETISKMYSGYVHAASPHIMDMCWGNPPSFQVSGMMHMPHASTYSHDLDNYLYRLLLSVAFCALALGQESVRASCVHMLDEVQQLLAK